MTKQQTTDGFHNVKGAAITANVYTFHKRTALALKVSDGACGEAWSPPAYLTPAMAKKLARALNKFAKAIEKGEHEPQITIEN